MKLRIIDKEFAICKVKDFSQINLEDEFLFIGKTDDEHSIVCEMQSIPNNCTDIDEGWIAFKIEGQIDFSLIGILYSVSKILAESKIGIFAVSTYNTDYIFLKKENYQKGLEVLEAAGYQVID